MDQVTYSFRYKIYKQNIHHQHKLLMLRTLELSVYNHIVLLIKRFYKLYHKFIPLKVISRHITKLKHSWHKDWTSLPSTAIRCVVDKIYFGYERFFSGKSKVMPETKSLSDFNYILFKTNGWILKDNLFFIKKQRLKIKFYKSREITGRIKTVQVRQDKCGDWWIVFRTVCPEHPLPSSNPLISKSIGIDFGLKHFLTFSDGTIVESPQFFQSSLCKIRQMDRKEKRKFKGSNNRKRARLCLLKSYRKVTRQRTDFLWKLAHMLALKYELICVENVYLKGLMKRWGRKVADLSFYTFKKFLRWECLKQGTKFVQIDRFEPTTKTCHVCGYKLENISLRTRRWTCPQCHTEHDRDVNAALNILQTGLKSL